MSIEGINVKYELVRIFTREFKARNRQVRVITRDPQDHSELPCLAINLIAGNEDNIGFNNILAEEYDSGVQTENNVYSGLISENCELRVWTEQAQERDDIGFEIMEIALLAKQELIKKNIGNMRLAGWRDEQDYKTFEPYFIHWKVLNFLYLNQYDVRPNTPATGINDIEDVTVDVQKET